MRRIGAFDMNGRAAVLRNHRVLLYRARLPACHRVVNTAFGDDLAGPHVAIINEQAVPANRPPEVVKDLKGRYRTFSKQNRNKLFFMTSEASAREPFRFGEKLANSEQWWQETKPP